MPGFEKGATAKVRYLASGEGPQAVEIMVPAGSQLEHVIANEQLVNALRGFLPRGCETCLSGREFIVKTYDDAVTVELER
jgi:hypothetical protein